MIRLYNVLREFLYLSSAEEPKVITPESETIETEAEKKKQDSNLTLSPLQSVDRDFAFIVDQKVTSKEIMNLVKNVDTQLIDNVKVFDIYQGGEIPQGKKSYAISVCLQPTDKTLTEEEINQLSEKIVLKIKKEIGAVLRD